LSREVKVGRETATIKELVKTILSPMLRTARRRSVRLTACTERACKGATPRPLTLPTSLLEHLKV